MPRNKVKAVIVGMMCDDEVEEHHLVVPEEATMEQCVEWAMSDEETDLPILCICFSPSDAQIISELWNASSKAETIRKGMH